MTSDVTIADCQRDIRLLDLAVVLPLVHISLQFEYGFISVLTYKGVTLSLSYVPTRPLWIRGDVSELLACFVDHIHGCISSYVGVSATSL